MDLQLLELSVFDISRDTMCSRRHHRLPESHDRFKGKPLQHHAVSQIRNVAVPRRDMSAAARM